MSKERLEEIAKSLNKFKSIVNAREFEEIAAVTLLEHGDWLIEQAKRALELEDYTKRLKKELVEVTHENNQKGRELEDIKDRLPNDKHALIKSNISLTRKAEDLDYELSLMIYKNLKMSQRLKKYQEMLIRAFGARDLKDISDIENEYEQEEEKWKID